MLLHAAILLNRAAALRIRKWKHIVIFCVTILVMRGISALLVAFLSHVIVGSFCMVPMAMAAEPQEVVMQHEHVNMTSADAMSHADCDTCKHHQQKAPSGCSGHCFTAAVDTISTINISSHPTIQVSSFVSSTIITSVNLAQSFNSNVPPGNSLDTEIRTIVLRQ